MSIGHISPQAGAFHTTGTVSLRAYLGGSRAAQFTIPQSTPVAAW